MSAVKQKLYTVKNRVNWKWTGAFILIVVFAYLGHQNLINLVLLPVGDWLYQFSVVKWFVDAVMLYGHAETWNWHSISASALIAVVSGVFCYFWGRHSIEVIEVNQPPPATPIEEAKPAEKPAIDYDAQIKELQAQIDKMKATKAE